MLTGAVASAPSGGMGGVGDESGHVVVVVVDEVVEVLDEVPPGAASAPAGAPMATSTSSEVTPSSAEKPLWRRRGRCTEGRSMDVFTDFIGN
jgi:hypothetical protein